jgi:hypothetical protein
VDQIVEVIAEAIAEIVAAIAGETVAKGAAGETGLTALDLKAPPRSSSKS